MKADVRLMLTADGSHTAVNQALNKTYHSIHGAYQESQRVYIELGLWAAFEKFPDQELRVFEMGFGTGLNALLTVYEATKCQRSVNYTAIDAFPMALEDTHQLNFDELLHTAYLPGLHESPWHVAIPVSPYFTLTKIREPFAGLANTSAFSPDLLRCICPNGPARIVGAGDICATGSIFGDWWYTDHLLFKKLRTA